MVKSNIQWVSVRYYRFRFGKPNRNFGFGSFGIYPFRSYTDLKYKTYNYFCCNYNTNLDFWQKNCISSDETSNIREQQYVFLQIYSFRICNKLYGYVWQWQWIFPSTLKTNVFKWLKYLKNNYLWLIVGTY